MKVKDPYFRVERVEKYWKEGLLPSRFPRKLSLPQWKYFESNSDEPYLDASMPDFDDSGWQDFRLGQTWGGYDRCAWFRTTVQVPEDFAGEELVFCALTGRPDGGTSCAEALVYIDGQPMSAFDSWHFEIFLPEEFAQAGRVLNIAMKIWSTSEHDCDLRTFVYADLAVLDRDCDNLCLLSEVLLKSLQLLDENDLRRIRMLRLLTESLQKLNFLTPLSPEFYDSVKAAYAHLLAGYSELAKTQEIKARVTAVGHSHVDMAWLWRVRATREKVSRTFSTMLNLMRQYPDFRFVHTSPQAYAFLKKDYPVIFEQVKAKIKEGAWEITGGMWVEPDTNIPDGESLIRQIMYGRRYIKEEFGQESRVVWLPDVFGYSGNLPQIMRKSGIETFVTTKISWNEYNHFPYDTFWWEGIDHSPILTHFITTPDDSWYYTYNGHMEPNEIKGLWDNYLDKDKNEHLLIAYGWGDGGGGPTREMVAKAALMKNVPGIPNVQYGGVEAYFKELRANCDLERLNKWSGELYFEFHRGTYTSQARNKRHNRCLEYLLHSLDYLHAFAKTHALQEELPKEAMERIWQELLLLQFHDILPGSAIREVYEDSDISYARMKEEAESLIAESLECIQKAGGAAQLLVMNPSSFARADLCLLPLDADQTFTVSYAGAILPTQKTPAGLWCKLPQIEGYRALYLDLITDESKTATAPSAPPAQAARASGFVRQYQENGLDVLETAFYRITLDSQGAIAELYDKDAERLASAGLMNEFKFYEDKPLMFDAWNIDIVYPEKPYQAANLLKREVLEDGALRFVLRQEYRFNKSLICQDMVLYADSRRIDFVTQADWHEHQVLWRAQFPTSVYTELAECDIQFGSIKRPVHTNTEWDMARFELPAQKWVDLSDASYGVALLNDCKYGFNFDRNIMGISLIKSGIDPDPQADQGQHVFTYALYPHNSSLAASDTVAEAYRLNQPCLYRLPLALASTATERLTPAQLTKALVSVETPLVMIDTVKPAEDGEGLIVRFHEYGNRRVDRLVLRTAFELAACYETNAVEEGATALEFSERELVTQLKPFEFKTLRLIPVVS